MIFQSLRDSITVTVKATGTKRRRSSGTKASKPRSRKVAKTATKTASTKARPSSSKRSSASKSTTRTATTTSRRTTTRTATTATGTFGGLFEATGRHRRSATTTTSRRRSRLSDRYSKRDHLVDNTYTGDAVKLTRSTPHKGWNYYEVYVDVKWDDAYDLDGATEDTHWYIYAQSEDQAVAEAKKRPMIAGRRPKSVEILYSTPVPPDWDGYKFPSEAKVVMVPLDWNDKDGNPRVLSDDKKTGYHIHDDSDGIGASFYEDSASEAFARMLSVARASKGRVTLEHDGKRIATIAPGDDYVYLHINGTDKTIVSHIDEFEAWIDEEAGGDYLSDCVALSDLSGISAERVEKIEKLNKKLAQLDKVFGWRYRAYCTSSKKNPYVLKRYEEDCSKADTQPSYSDELSKFKPIGIGPKGRQTWFPKKHGVSWSFIESNDVETIRKKVLEFNDDLHQKELTKKASRRPRKATKSAESQAKKDRKAKYTSIIRKYGLRNGTKVTEGSAKVYEDTVLSQRGVVRLDPKTSTVYIDQITNEGGTRALTWRDGWFKAKPGRASKKASKPSTPKKPTKARTEVDESKDGSSPKVVVNVLDMKALKARQDYEDEVAKLGERDVRRKLKQVDEAIKETSTAIDFKYDLGTPGAVKQIESLEKEKQALAVKRQVLTARLRELDAPKPTFAPKPSSPTRRKRPASPSKPASKPASAPTQASAKDLDSVEAGLESIKELLKSLQ